MKTIIKKGIFRENNRIFHSACLIRKIIAFILALCLLPPIVYTSAENSPAYTVDKISLIKGGVAALAIERGNFSAKITVTNQSEAGGTPLIMAMLCQGTKDVYLIRDTGYTDSESFGAGETKTITLPISCAQNENIILDELFIKVMVVKDFNSSTRLSEDAYYPNGDELYLAGIQINGTEVEGFSKDVFTYSFDPYVQMTLPLTVTADTWQDGASINVTQPDSLPGALEITVSGGGYSPVTYTVNILEFKSGKARITYINPKSTTGEYTIVENLGIGTNIHNAQNPRPITSLGGSELEGAILIQGPYNDGLSSQLVTYPYEDWITFTINRSANVYILDYLGAATSGQYMQWMRDLFGSYMKDGSGNAIQLTVGTGQKMYIFKKEYIVPEGEALSITYKSPGNYGTGMYGIAIKWLQDEMDSQSAVIPNEFAELGSGASELEANVYSDSSTDTSVDGGRITSQGSISGAEGKNIAIKVFKPNVDILTALPTDLIYYNITSADEFGVYNYELELRELRGIFPHQVICDDAGFDESNVIEYNPSSENYITEYVIDGVKGAISGGNITVNLPTAQNISGLIASYTASEDTVIYVDGTPQKSGVTRNNFTNPVVYRVIAEDGNAREYTVKVNVPSDSGASKTGGGAIGNTNGNSGQEVRISGGAVNAPAAQTPAVEHIRLFNDMTLGHWAADYVDFLVNRRVVGGYEDNTFRPENLITREEFVKILVNAFDLVPGASVSIFNDTDKNAWYTYYIDIAASNGIVSGISDGVFGVGQNITREDIAVMLLRTSELLGIKLANTGGEITFTDADSISEYALAAVKNLAQAGIINGNPNGSFNPKGHATRAETAVMVTGLITQWE